MTQISVALARKIAQTIAVEIGAQTAQVESAVGLLDEGATVPFIARYRKEVTGGLDDTQLRDLETRLSYLREMEDRRASILASIAEQGKLTDELRADIDAADSKSRLEDLYLPYKQKRRTRAQIAREAGLEPLADGLLADPTQVPEEFAIAFVDADKGVADTKAALEGARAILMERWGEDAELVGELRQWLGEVGVIRAKVVEGKETAGEKYRDYFDHAEPLAKIPSHRLLALYRGRREEFLQLDLEPGSDVDAGNATGRLVADIDVKDLRFTLDRQGVPRFATGVDDNDRQVLFIADAQGRHWTPVAADAAGTVWTHYAFSVDGTQVYALQSVNGGPSRLVASSPDGRDHRVLAQHPVRSVSDIEWGAGSLQPFAAVIADGKPRAIYFDPQSPDAQLHDALSNSFPDHYVAYVDHSRDGNRSLLYAFSDRDPGSWYLFDRAQGKASLLLSSREGLDAARMGERRAIRFRASDGMELEGFMTLPAGVTTPAGLPTVIVPHGGPHAVRDDWAFDQDAQFLASRGYLVLQVNYRGSGGRGRAFEEAGYLKWGTRVQDDLLDGLRWTIAQGYADGRRVCAYGASFGAYSAMMLAARGRIWTGADALDRQQLAMPARHQQQQEGVGDVGGQAR